MSFFSRKKSSKLFIKNKNITNSLESELLNLLRRKFNFFTQLRIGQLKQTHMLKKIRRDIARKKFRMFMNQ